MKFKPAADVVASLLREATPRSQRLPRRPSSAVELAGNRVLTVRSLDGFHAVTVALSESDRVRLTVGAQTFMAEGAKKLRKAEGDIILPITASDAGPVLDVQLDALPSALAPGSILFKMKVSFTLDALADVPTIRALGDNVVLEKAEDIIVPVSLGAVTLGPLPQIEGVDDDPVAQERMERWLTAALAFQDKQRSRR